MHELPFAKSIYKSVMQAAVENHARRVTKVTLEVGVLRDFIPELVQKYWNYVTRGDIAEGSIIEMIEIGASAKCNRCGKEYSFGIHDLTEMHCPDCNYDKGTLLTGRELKIMNIEIVE